MHICLVVLAYHYCALHRYLKGTIFFLLSSQTFPRLYSGKHGLLKRGTGNEREAVRTGDDENKHKAYRDYFMVGECVRFLFTSGEESQTNE